MSQQDDPEDNEKNWDVEKPRKVVDADREPRIININWHDLPSYGDLEVEND